VQGGVLEIGSHGYTHSLLTVTGAIFTVTKGAETITTDRTADTITLSGGGTVSGFRAKTLGAIKTELEGFGATVTTSSYGVGGIRAESLGEAFDDGTAVNTLEILHDATGATGIEKAEITDAKAILAAEVNALGDVTDGQTGATYVCNSFGFPYQASNAGLRAAVRAAGYTASQSSISYENLTAVVDADLFFIANSGSDSVDAFVGANEAATRIAARAIAFTAAQTGFVYFVLAHEVANISIEQWGWICEEWALFGDSIRVTSAQMLAKEIIDSVLWTDDGDGSYSRSFDYSDLHIKAGSPCIDAGADVGLTTDADGLAVPRGLAPDIGAYEMASTLEFRWHSGMTITADLVTADDVRIGDGLAATELTYGKGRYRVVYTGDETGHATLSLLIDDQYIGSVFDYDLTGTTGVHYPIIDFAVTTTGSGARTVTITVDDGTDALENATVRFTEGGNSYVGSTNASGGIVFSLDDATYNLAISKSGYSFTPTTLVVDGDETETYSMSAISITAPSAAELCTVQFRVKKSGIAVSGAVCKAQLLGINTAADGVILSNEESSDTTDAEGIAELELVQAGQIVKGSAIYKLWIEIAGRPVASVECQIPSQSTVLFEDLLP